MAKPREQQIGLGEFIDQVKREIIDYQRLHEGDEAFFEIEDVNLEITLAATRGRGGKVKLAVVELGGDVATEHTHKVQLNLSVIDNDDWTVPPHTVGKSNRKARKKVPEPKKTRSACEGRKSSRVKPRGRLTRRKSK